MRIRYYEHVVGSCTAKRSRSSLQLIDELFLFLVRLRLGTDTEDLADRFFISPATVSRKVTTWANYLYFVLGSINIWLSREEVNHQMPDDFKKHYPSTRVILDCTEIFVQMPSSLVLNSKMFSSYKNSCTVKCLIGIAPHGPVTFVSLLYTGNVSDVEIVRDSGILTLLEPGDSVMADKGFTISSLLKEKGIHLNTPHFNITGQFTPDEIHENQQVSSLRVHVERAIRRVKEYSIFSETVPLTMCGSLNQLWTVAVLLSNIKSPLVQKFIKNDEASNP